MHNIFRVASRPYNVPWHFHSHQHFFLISPCSLILIDSHEVLEGHLPAITPLHCLDMVIMPQSVYTALEDVAKAQLNKLLPDGKIICVPDGATPSDTKKACTHEALKHSCSTAPIQPGYCFTVKHHAEFGAAPREHLLPTRVPREKFCLTLLCVSVWSQRGVGGGGVGCQSGA